MIVVKNNTGERKVYTGFHLEPREAVEIDPAITRFDVKFQGDVRARSVSVYNVTSGLVAGIINKCRVIKYPSVRQKSAKKSAVSEQKAGAPVAGAVKAADLKGNAPVKGSADPEAAAKLAADREQARKDSEARQVAEKKEAEKRAAEKEAAEKEAADKKEADRIKRSEAAKKAAAAKKGKKKDDQELL